MEIPAHPRIAVVGAGALGGYVGARLAHSGEDVHFLVRSDYAALKEKGWLVRSIGECDFVVQPAAVYRNAAQIGPVDVILIGLKTTQAENLPEILGPLLRARTVLVTLQNGLGVAEALSEAIPGQRVLAGVCHIAATRLGPGIITNQAPRGGRIRLAPVDPEDAPVAEHLAEVIRGGGIYAEVLTSVDDAVWRKLMWNVPFNGLPVALGGGSLEDVFADEAVLCVVRGLMEELRAAANALGCFIPPAFTEQLIEFTRHLGAYQASTVIDYLAGRSLEVESIWGEPLRRGEAAGVPMPRLSTLYAILKRLDARSRNQARPEPAMHGG